VTLVGTMGSSWRRSASPASSLPWGLPSAATFAALLYGFLPSVWIHGVRPLSDGPAVAALLFSAACLIAARTGGRWWLLSGALLAALCAGFRPQAGITLLRSAPGRPSLPGGRGATPQGSRSRWRSAPGDRRHLAAGRPGVGGIASFLGAMKSQAGYVWSLDTLGPATSSGSRSGSSGLSNRSARPASSWRSPPPPSPVSPRLRAVRRPALVFAPILLLTVPFSALPVATRYVAILLPLPCGLAALAFDRFSRLPSTRR